MIGGAERNALCALGIDRHEGDIPHAFVGVPGDGTGREIFNILHRLADFLGKRCTEIDRDPARFAAGIANRIERGRRRSDSNRDAKRVSRRKLPDGRFGRSGFFRRCEKNECQRDRHHKTHGGLRHVSDAPHGYLAAAIVV